MIDDFITYSSVFSCSTTQDYVHVNIVGLACRAIIMLHFGSVFVYGRCGSLCIRHFGTT